MGAQGPHTSFISELAATTEASTCPPVSTLQGLLTQLAAVHREPHPEACVQFVSLELAGIFPCQCESSHHAFDICWVMLFCWFCFVFFVFCRTGDCTESYTEATQALCHRVQQPRSTTALCPFSLDIFLSFFFFLESY